LREHLEVLASAPPLEVSQFTAGEANLTYLLRYGEIELVLRRPPMGPVAPGAHDMEREWRVLSRLWEAYDRAPRAYLFCGDAAVAGAPFFVMERRQGIVVKDDVPEAFGGVADLGRQLGFAAIEALGDLHLVDPDACGLERLGRPDGFVARQVAGWSKRWHLVQDANPSLGPVMDRIARRLEATLPSPGPATLLHNDFKLDNCAFETGRPDRVSSVFDWDMATLGDHRIDVGTLLNYWPDPDEDPPVERALSRAVLDLGLPAKAELVERYSTRTGFDMRDSAWFEAFANWKTVVVRQQIHNRWLEGGSSDPRHEAVADCAPGLAAAACRLLGI
jgi:aminoglycoside phosphotransferase (APT) family kinase protein